MRIGVIAEPTLVIARRDNQRHAIMYFGYHLVCVGGDDREGANPLAGVRILPILPQSTDAEWAGVLHGYGIRLLGISFDRFPLEKAVNRQNTTASAIGIVEHRQLVHGLFAQRAWLVLAQAISRLLRAEPGCEAAKKGSRIPGLSAKIGAEPDFAVLKSHGRFKRLPRRLN